MINKKCFINKFLVLLLITITSSLAYAVYNNFKNTSVIKANYAKLQSNKKYPLIKELTGKSSLLAIYGLTKDNFISEGEVLLMTLSGESIAYIKDINLNLIKGKDIQGVVRTIMLQTIDYSYKYLLTNLPNAVNRNPDFRTNLPEHLIEKYNILKKNARNGMISFRDFSQLMLTINGHSFHLKEIFKTDWLFPEVPPTISTTLEEETLFYYLVSAFVLLSQKGNNLFPQFSDSLAINIGGPLPSSIIFLQVLSNKIPKLFQKASVVQIDRYVLLLFPSFEITNKIYVFGYFSNLHSSLIQKESDLVSEYNISVPFKAMTAQEFVKGNFKLENLGVK